MNKYRNEQGAALVLTLFIVTLLLLFLLTQFYQITNTTGQVTTMEKNIDARIIAEMGIDYYYQQFMSEYDEDQPLEDIGNFIDQLPKVKKNIDVNRSFEITKVEVRPSVITPETSKIEISYSSKGVAFEKEAIVDGKITINVTEQ